MKRIANSTLNASTLDILNVIRENAGYDYQNAVPKIEQATDIPKVGAIIYGTPALSNAFINAIVNRIASVRVQSATFNNPYTNLKKGYIEFGETIEDIFVGIAKGVDYTPEKGAEREFKRTLPDVRSVFHVMNWRVMYPVTIQDEDLKQAFLSVDGVTDLIAKIIDQVYTGAEYDEFLLFKYLLIKTISHGQMKIETIGDGTDMKASAKKFRGVSNLIQFMSDKFNPEHVRTSTPKDRQIIFMDANFNAEYDVDVLASAFNMGKADFMGRLYLIDNWSEFDNERFDVIRKNSDGLEEVTSAELDLMKQIKAVLCDENFFQVYDNNNKFTETYVASGPYWNYFYHTWKTVSYSPFANAIAFATNDVTTALPATVKVKVTGKDTDEGATVLTVEIEDAAALSPRTLTFVQTEAMTKKFIACQKYGAYLIPKSASAEVITVVGEIDGTTYTGTPGEKNANTLSASSAVGTEITLTKGE